MASVRLIAKRAGVSITTVSRVLNNHPQVSEELRQRVLSASNAARYSPTVGRRSTTNVALIYAGDNSIGSPFDASIMAGISREMVECGYELLILDARRARLPHESFTQMFMRKGVRGAIIRTTNASRSLCQTIAEEGFPAVVVGDRFLDSNVSYVYSDSRESSREAVEHLIGLGHRRIGISMNIVDDTDHEDRLAGYRQALTNASIEFDTRLVMRSPADRVGGAQLLRRLVTMPDRPTAIFITDPLTAAGTLGEARKMSLKIPDELSIVGFDDSDMRSDVYPTLTAVCQDAVALGFEAFLALKSLIDRGEQVADRPEPVRKALRTWLEVHESTGSITAPAAAIST